jgi:hypothetical protein
MVNLMNSKSFAYFGALLCRPRLTRNHRVMAPIIRRQQLVPASLCLLAGCWPWFTSSW